MTHADVAVNESGRSKGYGIVNFNSEESALAAIERLNGTELNGIVQVALKLLTKIF